MADQTTRRPAGANAWRVITALAVLVSGVTHFYLWQWDSWKDIDVIGPLFLVNAISGVIIAVLVLVWRHWFSLFLAFGFCVVTASAFLISRIWGLFGIQDTIWGWSQIVCLIAEVVGAVAAVVTFTLEQRSVAGARRTRPVAA